MIKDSGDLTLLTIVSQALSQVLDEHVLSEQLGVVLFEGSLPVGEADCLFLNGLNWYCLDVLLSQITWWVYRQDTAVDIPGIHMACSIFFYF